MSEYDRLKAQYDAMRYRKEAAAREAFAREALDDVAVMMSEFVDNWPNPKRLDTALKLIAKTLRAALSQPPEMGVQE